MRIKTLTLENFQGLKKESFNFEGCSASIYGENGTGKTTIFNAITWLLFDKASTGAKNFTPKTQGLNGDLHNLEHSVTSSFGLNDGRIITLKKTYKEIWKKKKGFPAPEFSGHSVDHQVDGVPVKEKEYIEAIKAHCGDENLIKLLMVPGYFAEDLPWNERRKVLLEMCGDVDDADVIAGNKELSGISEYLTIPGTVDQYYTVDEYKKIAASKRAEINRALSLIPARIDEAEKAISGDDQIDVATIDAAIKKLSVQIEDKKAEKARLLSEDGATAAINTQIVELTQRRAEAKAAHMEKTAEINEATHREIDELIGQRIEISKQMNDKMIEISEKGKDFKAIQTLRTTTRQQFESVQQSEWNGDEACPTCLRPLPAEDIQSAKEQFNLNKSNQLLELNRYGQQHCSKDMISELERQIEGLNTEVSRMTDQTVAFDDRIEEKRAELKEADSFESTQEYKDLSNQIADLQEKRGNATKAMEEQTKLMGAEISELQQKLEQQQQIKSRSEVNHQQRKRIEDLKAQEENLAAEYGDLERGIYLCDEFVKAKVAMLGERINSRFKSVRFRLFVEQINGGIKEDCEVLVPSEGRMVPYAFANNAGRINAGLEIINSLSKHWGMSVPVFVDNAESVTKLIDPGTQLIRMVVSEPDKVLRIEVDSDTEARGRKSA